MPRTCSMAGCNEPELCGVGPSDEPMCDKHYNEWLAAHRRSMDFFLEAIYGKD